MRSLKMVFLLAVMAGLLAGCGGSGPSAPILDGSQREEVLAYSEPLVDNLFSGLFSGDYRAFTRDLNKQMLEAFDNSAYQKLRDQLGGLYGAYQSRAVDKVVDYGKLVTVYYIGKFEKRDNVQITVTLTRSEPHQITGLWFK